MNKQFLIFLFILMAFCVSVKAAGTTIYKKPCEFLKPLHFKRGIAKVVIKAGFRGFFRSPEESMFHKLSKKKYLHYQDYFSTCCGGSSISFMPEECTTLCEATVRKGIKFDLNNFKPGTDFYLTCIVFKNFKGFNSRYFFLVDNISLKKP